MRQLSFKRHRFSPAIIRHLIWLYARFTLSFRDVVEMLIDRSPAIEQAKKPGPPGRDVNSP